MIGNFENAELIFEERMGKVTQKLKAVKEKYDAPEVDRQFRAPRTSFYQNQFPFISRDLYKVIPLALP